MFSTIAPWLGYLASLFLVISLIVTTDIRFRFYNLLGCVCFIIYALILKAWPVLITNTILFGINAFYLRQIFTRREKFDIIEFDADNPLARRFIDFYLEDIKTYYPLFNESMLKNNLNFFILRDLAVANIFSAHVKENGEAQVNLNYTAKRYRDFKVGDFLFDKERNFLISKGVRRLIYNSMEHSGHIQFLEKMGFSRNTTGINSGFMLELRP
jgi:hypothetical protein